MAFATSRACASCSPAAAVSSQRPRTTKTQAPLAAAALASPTALARPSSSIRRMSNATQQSRRPSPVVTRAAAETNSGAAASGSEVKPVVKIDNQSDNFATIVLITYGDKLGDLMDTIAALKNLGLNISRAKLEEISEGTKNKFFVTDAKTGEKITNSQKIEDIRLTILNNMLAYHPESAETLSLGKHNVAPLRDWTNSLGANMDTSIETKISIDEDRSGRYTVLRLITQDRPGLLIDVVQILKDVSVNVLSAEVDTIGDEADDTLLISYHGEALNSSMEMLVKNALQYYLSLAEVAKDESY